MDQVCELHKIYLYTRFERFWHWAQAALILMLAVTGFEVHGSYSLLGFKRAVELHEALGIVWLVLYTFIVFWHLTTGDWKNYIPTTKKLLDVGLYYLIGIFRGEAHPVPKSLRDKHNPLQRLTYLGISIALIPVQMITGLFYYTYNSWGSWGIDPIDLGLGPVALLHTAGAFTLTIFLIVHIYMTTTGHSLAAHLKAMCTGWEDVLPPDPDDRVPAEYN